MHGQNPPEQNCLGHAVNKVTIRKEEVDERNDSLIENGVNSWTEFIFVPHFRF
jgi:hypothetical protein